MNKEQALGLVVQEYPILGNRNTRIEKQFISTDGRISNTFLVETDNPEFKKFVAKSFVHHPESLRKEWVVLKLLRKKNGHAPQLLVPDHEPQNFLLMEYVEGIPASEALKQGHNRNDIFRKVGQATGIANSVELEKFGDILHPSDLSWKDYQMERLNNALPLVESLVDQELFGKIQEAIEKTKYILDGESKGKPALVHHDIYLENFILNQKTGEMVLIDYGIAFGGRPLFDLAKFYIWDLSKYPEQRENFLQGYSQFVNLPSNFNEVMKFYIVRECFGMIDFFHGTKDFKTRDDAINTLRDLVGNEGAISKLLT